MPCLFHATCSLWTSLAGIAKTSASPMATVCLLIFRACAALLVAGVYPVKSSAYDSTGKADYAFSPSTRRASTAGVQPSYLLRQCACCGATVGCRRTCRLPAPLHAGSSSAHDGRRSRRPVRFRDRQGTRSASAWRRPTPRTTGRSPKPASTPSPSTTCRAPMPMVTTCRSPRSSARPSVASPLPSSRASRVLSIRSTTARSTSSLPA